MGIVNIPICERCYLEEETAKKFFAAGRRSLLQAETHWGQEVVNKVDLCRVQTRRIHHFIDASNRPPV